MGQETSDLLADSITLSDANPAKRFKLDSVAMDMDHPLLISLDAPQVLVKGFSIPFVSQSAAYGVTSPVGVMTRLTDIPLVLAPTVTTGLTAFVLGVGGTAINFITRGLYILNIDVNSFDSDSQLYFQVIKNGVQFQSVQMESAAVLLLGVQESRHNVFQIIKDTIGTDAMTFIVRSSTNTATNVTLGISVVHVTFIPTLITIS